MRVEVLMPHLGYDMNEGKLIRWLKRPGDSVERGEAIAEIETDKTTIEMEALAGGRFEQIVCEDGQVASVGAVIAYLEVAD